MKGWACGFFWVMADEGRSEGGREYDDGLIIIFLFSSCFVAFWNVGSGGGWGNGGCIVPRGR